MGQFQIENQVGAMTLSSIFSFIDQLISKVKDPLKKQVFKCSLFLTKLFLYRVNNQ